MAEILEKYREQLTELGNRLNKRAKIVIGVVVIFLLIIFAVLILWNSNARYSPLFTNLNTQDAAAITERLKEKNISYKLSSGGSTVLVPEDMVYDLRLELAGEGLPDQGVVGFEIFDESQFGSTDFERKVNYYRALSGELSRSIRAMNGIDYARVQITAPRESLFVEEERPPSASVLLQLKAGFNINPGQVKAIANLVASSVQGLDNEYVTIVDTGGNLLSSLLADNIDRQTDVKHLTVQKNFEDGLKRDLNMLLTKVLGPDNFVVQVNAKLNFDQKEMESKTYSPVGDDRGIVRSEEINEETYEGSSPAAAGVPGTESNIPQYMENAENGETTGSYERNNTITNYEINEKIERHVYAAGDVEKLSVSVIVDDDLQMETLRKIEESVKAAIGFSEDRGDIISVSSINFDDSLEQEAVMAREAEAAAQKRMTYIYGGLIVLTLLVIIISLNIFRKKKETKYIPGEEIDYEVGQKVEEVEEKEELSEEEKQRRKMRIELEDVVTRKPEEVARLLKNWLIEE